MHQSSDILCWLLRKPRCLPINLKELGILATATVLEDSAGELSVTIYSLFREIFIEAQKNPPLILASSEKSVVNRYAATADRELGPPGP